MKKMILALIVTGALCGAVLAVPMQDSPGAKMKAGAKKVGKGTAEMGKATAEGTKDVAQEVGKDTKKVAKKTAKGAKKAGKATAKGTKKGIKK